MNAFRTRSARQRSPYPKADLGLRMLAKVADLLVAAGFGVFIPGIGVILGLVYLLACDGLPNGQSPGKRLLGVKAVHVPSRRSCGPSRSVVRNLPVALAFAFATNPFLAIAAVPILGFELYLVVTDPRGARIGDVFADTQVIDGKVPFEAPVQPSELLETPARRPLAGEVTNASRGRTP